MQFYDNNLSSLSIKLGNIKINGWEEKRYVGIVLASHGDFANGYYSQYQ